MDRRSFGRFLGLDDGARAPDETTIRRFREALVRTGTVEKLFARFDAHLEDAGHLARISRHGRGQLVDATIVAAPRQRMTDAGKEIVKGGGIPPDWQANPRKLAPETGAKGSRRALDAQARAQEDAPGRHGDGRNRHAGVRLQIPYQCRPAPRLRPDMDRHRRRPASRCPCITRGPMPHGRRSDPRSNIPSPG